MKYADAALLREKITAYSEDAVSNGRLGGAEMIVDQKGERVFHGCYGTSRLGGIYRIASMTKPVTACALLHLAGEGLVDLDAPVSRYIPEAADIRVGHVKDGSLVYDRPARNAVYMYQLLCHTSGIGTGATYGLERPYSGARTLQATAEYFLRAPLEFDPGTAQAYSPTAAFDVAAAVAERVTGEEFSAFLRRLIFGPLGMHDTGFDPSPEQQARMVRIHGRDGEGKSFYTEGRPGCVFEDFPQSVRAAGAGLFSTAEDYARFAAMLLTGTAPDGTVIVKPELLARMRTPHVAESMMPGPVRWGLGVRVIAGEGYPFGLKCGCFGWSGHYGTHFWVDPENGLTAVYMKNSRYDGGAGCATGNRFERDVTDSMR